ncbi:S4 domain-containing protein [Microbacterium sp. NPDC096154]|uniref:S4 domain-containing protein n=1 Tax=Microbacterium sp. NPDC096154 TaxID=3155549 RepID=UPI003322F7A2
MTLLDLVQAARPELTRSPARRLIAEGGVRINGMKCLDVEELASVRTHDVLQAGRRRWFKLAVNGS